jgi:hypothetical protein
VPVTALSVASLGDENASWAPASLAKGAAPCSNGVVSSKLKRSKNDLLQKQGAYAKKQNGYRPEPRAMPY